MELHVAFFGEQSQGRELVNWSNKVFHADIWRIASFPHAEMIEIEPRRYLRPGVRALADSVRYLLLWYWYDIGEQITHRASEAKISRARNLVVGEDTGDAVVILATPITGTDAVGAANKIKSFIRQHGTRLFACLRPVEFEETMCAQQAED